MPDPYPLRRQASQGPVRVSLACIPCRSQHIKCDAVMPFCTRCCEEKRQCIYSKSRRGRPRRHVPSPSLVGGSQAVRVIESDISVSALEFNASQSSTDDGWSDTGTRMSDAMGGLSSPIAGQLVTLYYSFFHAAHPCLLPQPAMQRYLDTASEALQLLYSVMQYIGSLFAPSVPSEPLKLTVEHGLTTISSPNAAITPFDVQAALLYSIAVYWCDELDTAKVFIDKAIHMALTLGMNRREYAVKHGRQDPVLEESWRRTWWQIYVTDAHIAGGTHTHPFRTSHVEMDVHLPCEERDYELGDIPRPRTLDDYERREFTDNEDLEFSSFAELIGLTRAFDVALTPLNKPDYHAVSTNVDAAVTAWSSLLPALKKGLQQRDGSFDEILFKANAIIFTYSAGLHRRLSTLAYHPVEAAARCPPPTLPERLPGCNTLECHLHTSKVLLAVERFNELLMLPTSLATHTPFIICMIASITKTQLAACRYVYSGQQLQLARERIRLNMGSLKALGEYWPLGKRTYKELGVIAQEILFPEIKSQQNIGQEPGPSQPIALVEQLPTYLLAADNAFDFGELYDITFRQATDSAQPLLQ